MHVFVQNCKTPKMEIFALCVINLEPIRFQACYAHQNDRLNLSFVKDKHTVRGKMARNSRKLAIFYCYSFLLRLYDLVWKTFQYPFCHILETLNRNYQKNLTSLGTGSFTHLNRLRSTKHRLLSTKRSMFSGLISIPFSKYDRAFSGSPHFNSCSACSISTLVSISSILSVRVSTFPRCFIIDPLRSPPPECKSLNW